MAANRTLNLPIRNIDGLEIPMNGTWPLVRASSVNRSSGRRRNLQQLHVLAGRLEIGDDPVDSSLRIDLDHSTLIANGAHVGPDRHGMSQWQFEGIAETAHGHDPLALTLNYHGLFRRGIDMWAWWSGTGTIGKPSGRRGLLRSPAGDDRVVVDLLFTAPDVTRIPRISPSAAAQRIDTRVMQLPRLGSQPIVLGLDTRHSLA
jgi:hypothetical protein